MVYINVRENKSVYNKLFRSRRLFYPWFQIASKADVRNQRPFFYYIDAAHQQTSVADVRSIPIIEQCSSGRLEWTSVQALCWSGDATDIRSNSALSQ